MSTPNAAYKLVRQLNYESPSDIVADMNEPSRVEAAVFYKGLM